MESLRQGDRRPLSRAASSLLGGVATALTRAEDTMADAARVTRFLRGALEFEVRPDDVFVVTYPRSGTTWTQMILHALLRGGATDFRHISEVTPWWERSLAYGHLSAQDLDALPSPRIFKSHLPFRWLPRGARYIYIIRDGRDVAVSYYHLYRSYLGFRGSFAEFFERYLRGDVQYGSWFKHVAGWQTQRDNPHVLFLRYEDMIADIEACIRQMAGFLRLSVADQHIADVMEKSSFQTMKSQEDKFDFIGEFLLQRGMEGRHFIRKGQVAEGARCLSPAQKAAFDQRLDAGQARPDLEWRLAEFLH